jgi:hypothetical protein
MICRYVFIGLTYVFQHSADQSNYYFFLHFLDLLCLFLGLETVLGDAKSYYDNYISIISITFYTSSKRSEGGRFDNQV